MAFTVGPPSTDAKLKEIAIEKDKGTLIPGFNPANMAYKLNAPKDTKEIELTLTPEGPGAKMEVDGKPANPGVTKVPVPGTITVIVTAQDGKAKETYTVVALVGASNDGALKELAISAGALAAGTKVMPNPCLTHSHVISLVAGALAPKWDPKVKAYTDTTPPGTSSVTVTPTVNNGAAKVTVDGKAVENGKPSEAIPVSDAKETDVSIAVTAQVSQWLTAATIPMDSPYCSCKLTLPSGHRSGHDHCGDVRGQGHRLTTAAARCDAQRPRDLRRVTDPAHLLSSPAILCSFGS